MAGLDVDISDCHLRAITAASRRHSRGSDTVEETGRGALCYDHGPFASSASC